MQPPRAGALLGWSPLCWDNGKVQSGCVMNIHVMNCNATGCVCAASAGQEVCFPCIPCNALISHAVILGPQQPAAAVKLALMEAEVGPQTPEAAALVHSAFLCSAVVEEQEGKK